VFEAEEVDGLDDEGAGGVEVGGAASGVGLAPLAGWGTAVFAAEAEGEVGELVGVVGIC
jgi:hypothetical protein